MRTAFLSAGLLLFVAGLFMIESRSAASADKDTGKSAKVLRHVVLFKFKDSSTPEQIKEVENAFRALPAKIDAILDFEWGTDVSVENKADGFTHCFFVTFKNEKDRETYLPHPAHKDFVKIVGPHVDKVLVVDYWSSK